MGPEKPAGGMSAKLEGREFVDMMDSLSQSSSRTDDGRGEGSLGGGIGVNSVGESGRNRDRVILTEKARPGRKKL